MNVKKVNIILLLCLLLTVNSYAENAKNDSSIKIHLPREITIKNNSLILGQVSIIRGPESLVSKASKIALGQISVPGQKIVLDRKMILSRLACNGIPAWKVKLTGAEKITIKQPERTISSDEFVKLASSFLEKNPPDASICGFDPIRIPQDFIIPGDGKNVTFSVQPIPNSAKNQVKIEVTIFSDSKKIGTCEVIFGLKYNYQQIVTKVDIPAGTTISEENVKIEKIISNQPESPEWESPYGLITRRDIPANKVIQSNMLDSVKSPIITKRNQKVLIRVDMPGFLITTFGKAMQDGRAGEYIKVRNVDSQRIFLARINEDGSVKPVF